MTSYLDRLNLRPYEKRLVVAIAAILFVVLNWAFVFPHFSDWSQVQTRRANAQTKLANYLAEIRQMTNYQDKVTKLEGLGSLVPPEEQALHFASAILTQVAQDHVTWLGSSSLKTTSTNQLFLEQSEMITVQSGEQQLVDLLYHLGTGGALIRVRSLSLQPDPPRQQLSARVTLVANYQKNPPPKVAPASTKPLSKAGSPLSKTTSPRVPLPKPTTKEP